MSKQIALVNGRGVALVSDEDYELLSLYRWYNVKGYARRVIRHAKINGKWKYKWRYMHQDVLPALDGLEVDHIDRDPLNNQRENLRLVTHTQQMHNTNASGVFWDVARHCWRAEIMRYGTRRAKRFLVLSEAIAWRARMLQELQTP